MQDLTRATAPLAGLLAAAMMLLSAGAALAQAVAPPGAPTAAAAAPAELRVGAGYSDNITRNLDVAAISAKWLEAGFTGTLGEKTERLESSLVADITYRDYSESQFGKEFIGGANGHLGLKLFDDAMKWEVDDVYGQALINTFAADTPQNRQGMNFFSTGPDFTVPLGERTQSYLNARWGTANYDALLLDSKRRSVTVGLQRRISSMTTVRIQAAGSHIDFEQPDLNPPVDVRDYSVGMHREAARSTIDAEVGQTHIKVSSKDETALLARLTAVYRVSEATALALNCGHEYSDSGEFFRLQQNDVGPVGPAGPAIQAADPLRSTYGNLTWTRTSARTTLRLVADMRRDRRQTETFLDVNQWGATGGVGYRFSARFDGGLEVRARRNRFVEGGETTEEQSAGLALHWNSGARVRLTALFDRTHGTYGVAGIAYNENRVSLLFGVTGRR